MSFLKCKSRAGNLEKLVQGCQGRGTMMWIRQRGGLGGGGGGARQVCLCFFMFMGSVGCDRALQVSYILLLINIE